MKIRRIILSIVLLLLFAASSRLSAQTQMEGFRSTYTSAITVTPINTAFDIVPNGMVDLVFSLSAEYSLRRSDHLAYAIYGGYYPYLHRTEGTVAFALRTFTAASLAPTGTFFDWSVIAGVENDRPTDVAPNPETLSMFGLGVRVGGLRNSRFNWFAFEYGAGTSVVFIGGRPQFRAQLFFGLGFLLGREVLVN
jgi:hypothetical protein